ncbi:MAG: sigma-70 family RNA polymerase sigma factor [Deltaproteobacteria bacterium]|nr:sigma-70 family RNA polymerase sigma factor [Deltaproteobacteria bacterium]
MISGLAAEDTPNADVSPSGGRAREAALLGRVAIGDDDAFAELYEAHRRRLYRLAYGVLLDPNEAHEAVQEAFLALHRAAPKWEPRAAVSTWLYRVVLNHCLSLKQRLLRFARPAPTRSPSVVTTPEGATSVREAVAIVERSLASLPTRQRAVACLFLEAELGASELAPLVGMTPNAARVTLHRALARLRSDLSAAGIDAPPTLDEPATYDEEN